MKKGLILIVEDEAIIAIDIKRSLVELGYDVTPVAVSGIDAIQKAEEYEPDLVLMDIVMPGETDGIEAAREIQSKLDIPVVYLTAYADKEIVDRAKTTKPYGYITKPFTERDLYSNIEIALYKHKMNKKLKDDLEVEHRLNRLLLQREVRINELKEENEKLKLRIKELEWNK
jgi:CheY-like chemotaxis protein